MKNKLIIFILCLLIGVGFTFYLTKQYMQHKTGKFRIALFIPAIHPSMDAIEQGFKETIQKQSSDYTFDVYNAGGNKTLLRGQAEEIVQNDYDLIFTIGAACTQTIFEITKKRKKETPVVFTAVDNPDKVGLVQSLKSSKNNLTGVISELALEKQLAYLFRFRPEIKKVLLVYDPSQGIAKQAVKKEIEKIVNGYDAKLLSVEIYQTNEIQQKVSPLIADVHAIVILQDHAVVASVESLITLCKKYGVTLYASDQHSAKKGAALAFDISEYEYSSKAAEQALLILEKNKKPTDIPVCCIVNQRLYINAKTMDLQGLNLKKEQLNAVVNEGGIIL